MKKSILFFCMLSFVMMSGVCAMDVPESRHSHNNNETHEVQCVSQGSQDANVFNSYFEPQALSTPEKKSAAGACVLCMITSAFWVGIY